MKWYQQSWANLSGAQAQLVGNAFEEITTAIDDLPVMKTTWYLTGGLGALALAASRSQRR